jgi:hypothetical protein
MGEDWIRRTQETWRRSLRRKVEEQTTGVSLFEDAEEEIITYPCHLIEPGAAPAVGSRVVILQRTPHAKIAVLLGNLVVGLIDGDAARDLRTLFDLKPELCRALAAEVIATDHASARAELAVARTMRRGG